jgi:hypothetical protein
MRRLLLLLLLAASPALSATEEHIFVSGGPALRYFERHKVNTHDVFWGNFIQAALARHRQIASQIPPDAQFTWLVFRPGYERRSPEAKIDLIAEVEKSIKPTGANLIWFSHRDELIHYINEGQDRRQVPIARLEYFGHSNKRNWMFDYSNRLDGAVADYGCLHVRDLPRLKRTAFAPHAVTQSWGCHSGEEFSAAWRKATGVPMIGAIGKTNYSNGGIPFISTPGGRWTQ